MATWFTITYEGEPTEADFARVAELAAGGFTSGQLLNEPGAEDEEGPATGTSISDSDLAAWTEQRAREWRRERERPAAAREADLRMGPSRRPRNTTKGSE